MPDYSGMVFRRRLFLEIEQAPSRALVWIAAPPAAGKTSLASTWLHSAHAPAPTDRAVWYRVDEADEDPTTFFRALKFALKDVPGAPIDSLSDFAPEASSNVRSFAESWFETLFGSDASAPYIFVFDDVHRVPQESVFFVILAAMTDMMRGSDRILCLSRQAPPPAITAVLPRSRLVQITDLLVSPEEFEDFKRSSGPAGALSPESFQAQLRQAGNWISDLNIVSSSPFHLRDLRPGSWSNPDEYLKLFTEEEKLPLLATAFLQVADDDEWIALGGEGAARTLARLADEHVFVVRLMNGALRKHDLFHDWLRGAAEAHLAPDALRTAQLTAGRLLIARDELLAGARLLAQAGAVEEIHQLVLARGADMYIGGRTRDLLSIIKLLPPASVQHPAVGIYQAYARVPYEPQRAREEFARIWRSTDPAAEPFAYAGALIGEIRAALEDWSIDQRITALVEETRHIRDSMSAYPGWAQNWITFARSLAILVGQPSHPEAADALHALEATLPKVAPPLQFLGHCALANWYLRGRGDLAGARVHLSAFQQLREHHAPSLSTQATWYNVRIGVAFREGDTDTMVQTLEEARSFAQRHGVPHKVQAAYSLLAQAFAANGDHAAAADALFRFENLNRQSHRTQSPAIHHLRAAVALSFGDAEKALAEASLARSRSLKSGWSQGTGNHTVLLAMAHALRGDSCTRAFIDELRKEGRESQNRVFLLHAELAETYLAYTLNDRQNFVRLWQQLAVTAAGLAFRRFSGMDASHLSRLANRALAFGADVGATRTLVELWDLSPPKNTLVHEDWPHRVQITCLGGFAVHIDGNRSRSGQGKAQRKPLELLWLLIVAGDRGVGQEHLADVLWPDLEGDRAMHTLRTTLYRLRKLIGAESLVQEDEHIQLNSSVVSTDLSYLRSTLNRMRDTRLSQQERQSALDQALRLYRGPLLPGIELVEVAEERNRIATSLATEGLKVLLASDTTDPATTFRTSQLEKTLPRIGLQTALKRLGLVEGRDE